MGQKIRVAELFAGVGGFRHGFDNANADIGEETYETVWANQWEPPGKESKQFAWRCYEAHYGAGSCENRDIAKVLDDVEAGAYAIPEFDMLVGGFPCQAFSVARPKSRSHGLDGDKGVLWWQIYRMLKLFHPKWCLFENVDRLLKSPSQQRGRDFAVILSCLWEQGYDTEWRVVNAADFGMPQRRRRVYIFCTRTDSAGDPHDLINNGIMAKSFPFSLGDITEIDLPSDPQETYASFGNPKGKSPIEPIGAMCAGKIATANGKASYSGHRSVLADVLSPEDEIDAKFYIPDADYPKWEYTRSSKHIPRTDSQGHSYIYSEGAMACPDPTDKPARTILTGSGGRGASRMKHIIETGNGEPDRRYRILTPDELDQLQRFPKGWTSAGGLTDSQRTFCMGNALVTDIPRKIAVELASSIR